jgi:hypothetical protein
MRQTLARAALQKGKCGGDVSVCGKRWREEKRIRLSLNMELEHFTFVRNVKSVNARSKRGKSYSCME